MALIPLQVPAGMRVLGTDCESQGRWRDGTLVRWLGGSLRPVGGWEERVSEAFSNPCRGLVAWRDNDSDAHLAGGSSDKLIHISAIGAVADITPAGLALGYVDAQENLAFGGGYFGLDLYGVESEPAGLLLEATSWSVDAWGEYLVACSSSDGKLYEWQLDAATPTVAAQIANSPEDCKGLVVTDERFLFALCADGNLRKIAWSDREDNTTWTALSTNEAGDFEIQTSGEIMQGLKIRGRTLILTTDDAHTATYQGPPYVYGFERVGNACGTISRHSAVSVDVGAFWMGRSSFFVYDGSSVSELPCEVADKVFTDINTGQSTKVYAVHNGQHGEVWWFYPSGDSLENDSYVFYDYKEQHWAFGKLARTSGVDKGTFVNPIWIDDGGNIYNQEKGTQYGGLQPFVESGPVSIANGDTVMKVNSVIPDEKTQGDVSLTFKTRFYPNGDETEYGPYSTANPTDVRFTGRQVRMRIEQEATQVGGWRVGVVKLNAEQGGRR